MSPRTSLFSLVLSFVCLAAAGPARAADAPLAQQLSTLSKQIRAGASAMTPEARRAAGLAVVTLFDRYLSEVVVPNVPASPEAVAQAFADYRAGRPTDLPLRRQVDDTGLLGYWHASHELALAAMDLRRALKALDLPQSAVQDVQASAGKDVGIYVADLANPDRDHFEEALGRLTAGLGALVPRLAAALAALAPADGGSTPADDPPAPGFAALSLR